MFDGSKFGEEVVGIVQDYVQRNVAPLQSENEELKARIKALEDRPEPELLEAEPLELPDFGPLVQDAVVKAIDALPKAKDGENGAGIAAALIDREGNLILTLSNGETHNLGKVVGKDAETPAEKDGEVEEWASQLSTEERAVLVAAMLRKEIGSDDLFDLPDLPPLSQASPHPAMVVHNHLPSRGREKTVVTKHDDRGRIIEFERFEQ